MDDVHATDCILNSKLKENKWSEGEKNQQLELFYKNPALK
jgi:hypothetical protein